MPSDEPPTKGAQYRHPDGTTEVVFAVAEGRVLTIREYGSVEAFERAIDAAQAVGTHEGVVDLPDPEEFEEML